jgi:hypothetical protein
VRHSAIAPSGAQNNSLNLQGGLWLTKAVREPNSYRRQLHSPGALDLSLTGMTL